jgi:hypothetical protein
MIVHFPMETGMLIFTKGQAFSTHKGIILAVKRVEFINDRMSYNFKRLLV